MLGFFERVSIIVAFLALSVEATAQTTEAQTIPLDLEWLRGHGAESCPDAKMVAAEIEDSIGHKVFSPGAKHTIEVLITRTDNLWTARIEERDSSGVIKANPLITHRADDCAVIQKVAEFNVVMLLEHAPPPPPPPPPPPAPPPIPFKTTFVIRAALRYGLLPGAAPDIGFSGTIGRRWWEFSGGLSWMPEAATIDRNTAYGLMMLSAGGCGHPFQRSRIQFSGCGHVWFGAIHNTVLNLDGYYPAGVGEQPWLGIAVGPRLRIFPFRSLVFEIGGDLSVLAVRRQFFDDGREHLFHEQSWFGLSGFFGVGVSIP